MKTIFTGLSPNTEKDDVLLALKLLFMPWKWRKGKARIRLENLFKDFFGSKFAFAFESGRTSLYAILSSLNLQKDDEVLLQAYTCVAVPEPILWSGARAIYVDCNDNLTMSAEDLEKKITSKSKVLIIQHTFGFPADMEKLLAIAKKFGLFVIEDCAHTIGGEYHEKKLGTFGDVAVFSIGRDKLISSVFGGMIITNNDLIASKISELQNQFPEAKNVWIFQQLMHPLILTISKFTYNFLYFGKIFLEACKRLHIISKAVCASEKIGGKPDFTMHKMPNALALLAINQFNKLGRFNLHREKITKIYDEGLVEAAGGGSVFLSKSDYRSTKIHFPHQPPSPIHKFYLLRYTVLSKNVKEIMEKAKAHNILLGDWYDTVIAPKGVDYKAVSYNMGSCPNAENLAKETFNLPTNIQITEDDAERILKFLNTLNGNS